MEENYGHKPVLLHECLDALAIKPDGIYVDGTLGRAGHSLEIVRRLTTGRLIALDRDETAIEAANRRLGDYLDKVTLVHSNFSALDAVLHELGVHGVDGMLFDLGVSSPQLRSSACRSFACASAGMRFSFACKSSPTISWKLRPKMLDCHSLPVSPSNSCSR